MQDHELNMGELGNELPAEIFEFEPGRELGGGYEVGMEIGNEAPLGETQVMELAAAAANAIAPQAANSANSVFRAAAAAARQAASQLGAASGAPAQRRQSGRWMRFGHKIVLFGV